MRTLKHLPQAHTTQAQTLAVVPMATATLVHERLALHSSGNGCDTCPLSLFGCAATSAVAAALGVLVLHAARAHEGKPTVMADEVAHAPKVDVPPRLGGIGPRQMVRNTQQQGSPTL